MTEREAVKALGTTGRRLWQKVSTAYNLGEHERVVLLTACRTADLLDRLQAAIEATDLSDWGSARGLLGEHRQQAVTLARLMAALRVPEDDDPRPEKIPRLQRRTGVRGVYGV